MTEIPVITHDLTAAQAERLAAIEAAPDAPESLRERVARAMYCACGENEIALWKHARDDVRREMYTLANAALRIITEDAR